MTSGERTIEHGPSTMLDPARRLASPMAPALWAPGRVDSQVAQGPGPLRIIIDMKSINVN